ncbi:MAG: DegV family EDD domain-containing protein [Thermoflexus hugenholtzii]|jgi:DegV family protein with EDD domain|uniref:DegV family protein n=1 Tax=Thermoflexus TaxID=1495649 RepID=UPI001C74460C|nr:MULTISPECIES: DegV family protein [Thermoflexus]QWK09511.1 MAG: DegV family EDD domain-containing protein [Thermoflexus hugenholtzii]
MPVRVLVDSAALLNAPDLPGELLIRIPLTIRADHRAFREGIDEIPPDLWPPADRSIGFRLEPPGEEALRELYLRLAPGTSAIVAVLHSGRLSPLVAQAQAAASAVLGRCPVHVLDTQTLGAGQGWMAETALRLAAQGQPAEEIVRRLRGMLSRIYTVFITESLEPLERNRLLSKTQRILGTMLGIRPFLMMEEGALLPLEKARSTEKALEKLLEFAAEFSRAERVAVLYGPARAPQEAHAFAQRLQEVLRARELRVYPYGPSLAAWIGFDGLGVTIQE